MLFVSLLRSVAVAARDVVLTTGPFKAKALELFMISLVTKAASEARSRSSKRVTAAHLKQAVAKDEVLDFLAEIIAKVPDAPAPSEKVDEGSDATEGKKRRGGTRKKRKDSEDF